jgi:PAS domain S-box-containing protein
MATSACADERFFKTLFDTAPDGFVVLSENRQFVDANPAACQLTGFARHDLIGRSVTETIETDADFESAWNKFKREGQYRGQRWLVRADGARRLIEIRATAYVLPGCHLAIWRDVTDRYFLERELLKRERDEALARLAGGIAHDLTNRLNVIGGHTELIARELTPSSDVQAHIASILEATQYGAALTAQLSALARQQVLSPAVLDLGAFIHSCAGALQSLVGENIELILPGAKSSTIRVDRTQLAQVIFTLASTASESLSNGGQLSIEVQNATLKQAVEKLGFRIPAGDYVVLELQARERRHEGAERVSLPQGQLPPPKRAVHAALPAVTATVKQNNGFMWVDRNSAGDTTLSVYFPSMAGHVLAEPEKEHGARGGSETILVAEDDPGVREATREYLKCIGYRVLAVSNGEDALQSAQSAGRIDALITDLRMPKMGGKELAERLSAALPEIKVMFVSGYIDREFIHQTREGRGPALLSKPFEMRALAKTLRDLLDGKESASRLA